MTNYISYDDIYQVLLTIYQASKETDRSILAKSLRNSDLQKKLKQARAIEASIRTHNETETKTSLPNEHTPARLLTFLLSYFAEHALIGAELTIENDDPVDWVQKGKAAHANTYRLKLHNPDMHEVLFAGDAQPNVANHDLDTVFLRQVTQYSDNSDDTTKTAFDSFTRRYATPFRRIEVKSALWSTNSHIHDADYVLKFDYDGVKLLNPSRNFAEQLCYLSMTGDGMRYYYSYLDFLDLFNDFKGLTWEDFILDD